MNIPFLDLKAQYRTIRDEINPAIQEVLDNTAYVLGKSVAEFEKSFAEMHDAKHCIGLSSGTAGNHVALWAHGIGPGDEVILPANTFIATAWGATLCGAKPVFVDCEPESYNIDPDKTEQAITDKTKAIVAVHLYGQPADMDRLREIADRRGVLLVEDAAQAHIAEYKKRKAGSLSSASSFSFYPGKNLGAFGEAGAVLTNDDDLAEKCRKIRDHGAEQKYYHVMPGHNYRMEGIQGAVLGVKLKYLEKWTEERKRAAATYKALLNDLDTIILPREMEYANHVFHLFVIRVKEKTPGGPDGERDKLRNYLMEKGIATGLHYPVPLHLQKVFAPLGYNEGDLPNAETLARECLSLPVYPELTDDKIEYVCSTIRDYFND